MNYLNDVCHERKKKESVSSTLENLLVWFINQGKYTDG